MTSVSGWEELGPFCRPTPLYTFTSGSERDQPCVQLKKKHVCHALFVTNTLMERSVCRARVVIDVFTWLPMVGNGKRFRMYLRVVIVHFFTESYKNSVNNNLLDMLIYVKATIT